MAAKRIKLGAERGLLLRRHLFLGKDAVEIDEAEGYDVYRRRVLFTDVELITQHHYRSWRAFLWLLLMLGTAAGVGAGTDGTDRVGALGVCALGALPAVIYLLRGGTHVVTVFGRRSRARLLFPFRVQRARSIFQLLVDTVGRVQNEAAAQRTGG